MLFKFAPRERVQCKFVRLEKMYLGETDIMNSGTAEKLYPEFVPYGELKREVVGNKTLFLMVIMELLGFVFLMAFDVPSMMPSSCSNSLVTKLKGF